MAVRFNRGKILEIVVEPDGVDYLITPGCGNPNCAGCSHAPRAWMKVVRHNHPIAAGWHVHFKGEKAKFYPPTAIKRLGPMLVFDVSTPSITVDRVGFYRVIKADGRRRPAKPFAGSAPAADCPDAAELESQWASEPYTGPQ